MHVDAVDETELAADVYRIAGDCHSINSSKLANDSASLSKVTAGNVIVDGINIGIGIAATTDKLHVAGTARFDIGGGRISLSTPGGWPGLIALAPPATAATSSSMIGE